MDQNENKTRDRRGKTKQILKATSIPLFCKICRLNLLPSYVLIHPNQQSSSVNFLVLKI